MLKPIAKRASRPMRPSTGARYAIVAAKYNPQYTDALLDSALEEMRACGAKNIEVVRVPGAFETPAVAARLANSGRFDAIICFGAILRGATTHAQQIADGVSLALAQLQIQTGVPIVHAVLLFENEKQAKERCFGTKHNRGIEAARVAVEMAEVMQRLPV